MLLVVVRRSCLLFVICIERECTYRGILLVKVSGNLSGRRNSFFFSKYFELYQDVKLGAVEIQLAERSLPTSEHLGSNPIKFLLDSYFLFNVKQIFVVIEYEAGSYLFLKIL